jgi:hypothetical protein
MKIIKYLILLIVPLAFLFLLELPKADELDWSNSKVQLQVALLAIGGFMLACIPLILLNGANPIVKFLVLFIVPVIIISAIPATEAYIQEAKTSILITVVSLVGSMLAFIPLLMLRRTIRWGLGYSLGEHINQLKKEKTLNAEAKLEKVQKERQIASGKAHREKYGVLAAKITCPHCNEKGQVWRNQDVNVNELTRETGIGAVIGKRTITEKKVTNLHCKNCGTTWSI